jgi:hypothetical protein
LDLLGSVFQGVADDFAFFVLHSVVELPPEANLLDDVLDRPLLGPFLLGS